MKEMTDKAREEGMLIRNLADAGLCTEEIEEFLSCCRQNKQMAKMRILNEHRGKLLCAMQDSQERLYCLDYLIRSLKKNNKGEE